MSSPQEKEDEAQASHVQEPTIADEKSRGKTHEVTTASVALAAAVAEQKPNIWSKNMIKLYGSMGSGDLISSVRGVGRVSSQLYSLLADETALQTAHSWVPSTP